MLKKLLSLLIGKPQEKARPTPTGKQQRPETSAVDTRPLEDERSAEEIAQQRQLVSEQVARENHSLNRANLLFYDYLLGPSKNSGEISGLEYDLLVQVNEALSHPDKMLDDFPKLPQSLAQLIKFLDADDFELQEFSRVVERDPPVATQLIAVANSAQYNHSGKDITDIRQAFMLLGSKGVKQHVLQGFVKNLSKVSPVYFKFFGEKIWLHCDDTATICRYLASKKGLDAETAFLIGLLHDVGKIFVFKFMVDSFKRVHPDEQLESLVVKQLLQKKSMELSIFIIRKWGLPAIIENALSDLAYYQKQPKTALGQVLIEANLLSERCLVVEHDLMTVNEVQGEIPYLSLSEDAVDYLQTRLDQVAATSTDGVTV